MPNPMAAIAGVSGITSIIGGNRSANAATSASNTQAASAQAGIAEQQRQFEAIQKNLSPFISAGSSALAQQLALIGVGGQRAQAAEIAKIENGFGFQESVRQGENAILQNASATGGLRGGNTQAALAQFRPAMLQQAIDAQYQRLGGLAAGGQASAAMTGQAGQQSAAGISNLLAQQGQAVAGGQIAGATAFNQGLGGVGQAFGFALSNPAVQQSLFGASPQFPATPNFAGLY